MSAEAVAWTWKSSPYEGAQLLLHLALADIANDTNDNLIWVGVSALAEKARTSRETASRWLWTAVRDGYLQLTTDRRGQRSEDGHYKPSEFRFLTPERVTTDHATRDDRSRAPVTTDHATRDDRSHRTQEITQEETQACDEAAPSVAAPRRRRRTQVPEDFALTELTAVWCQANRPDVDVAFELAKFIDHHRSKGNVFIDHQRAFQTWMRNARPTPQLAEQRRPRPPLMAPIDDLPPDHANGIAAIRQARQAMRVG